MRDLFLSGRRRNWRVGDDDVGIVGRKFVAVLEFHPTILEPDPPRVVYVESESSGHGACGQL